jgi:PAS domain S-box-containing protein
MTNHAASSFALVPRVPQGWCDVDAVHDLPADELTQLRDCLHDLGSIIALPHQWTGGEPADIMSTLLDALLRMIRLGFVYARLQDAEGEDPIEIIRVAESLQSAAGAREIRQTIEATLGAAPATWPSRTQVFVRDVAVFVACAPLGIDSEVGLVIAGSTRPDFPTQIERLVLDVAANQATLGLQQARLLSLQRRAAEEPDIRVARRTGELAAANERSAREVRGRRGAEEAVGEREHESRLIMDTIPGMVALLTATGEIELLNRQLLEYFGQTQDELRDWAANGTIHSEDLSHVMEVFSRSIASGSPYDIVQRFRRWDGAYRWFQNRGFPLRDRRGEIVRWCVLLTDIDERKRAEEALRDRERESRLIVDSIPGLVAAFTPSGEVEFVNRQTVEYFGRTLEDLERWETTDAAHPEDLPRVFERFTHSIASGDPFEFEVRARRYDGVYRWFQSRGFPLRDGHGRIVRWYNLLIDIDERKRAETRLAGEVRLLDMVASGCSLTDVLTALCSFVEDTATNCYCGVYLIDWSGPTFHIAAAPTLPASFNDPIDGLPVRSEIGPCARAACLETQVIAADIESDPLWQASPFRVLALTNGLRSCWSTPIYSLAGHVLGTFAIYQRTPGSPTPLQQDLIAQVTHIASIAIERAQSEAALKRSEAFLAEGQRLSLSGSFCWKVATDKITWSEQLYRIYEIEIGTPVTLELIRTRVHPEDVSLFEQMKMVVQARGGGDDFEWQYRLLMPDYSIKYLHAVAHATRDRDGQLEYIAVVQDVTERRLSEEALSKARSELAQVARVTSLGVLTASIAHEVNQPLSGIITNAGTCLRMLDADPPNLDGARETARRTIRDGNRAADVITRLRALFSKKDFTLEPVDLNDATREVIALSLSDLRRQRVVLQSELAEDLPKVIGDRVQLQQVILNLLRNASDAMVAVHDRPRQLLIRTEREGGERVRVSVRDAGGGVDARSINKLFDAFYTTKSDGMGMGLSVSRSIIERHQGRLWAEPNDGPGATFSFSIPSVQTSVTATRPR